VTDANLVLGYMSPMGLIGGQLGLDKDAAVRAMESVAAPLGMDPTQAAAGAIRIVNHHMGELMRQMTVEQGLDPRDFVIYAYGGAGPLHATGFARELGAKQVIVPLADMASTWSALGVVSSDILHVYEHAELMSEPFSPERLNTIFRDMEQRAAEQLRADGIADDDMSMSRSLDMKFSLQIHEVEVPLGSATITAEVLDRQMEEFVHLYESIFGRGSAYVDAGVQIGLCRVRARGRIRQPDLAAHGGAEGGLEPGRREVFWPELGQFEDTAIYDGAALPESFQIAGPAVIELPDTTILVHPGDRARLDQHGSVVLDLAADVGGGNGSSHLRRLVND
jgi:N-methylhydantoinase A